MCFDVCVFFRCVFCIYIYICEYTMFTYIYICIYIYSSHVRYTRA